MRQVGAR